METTVPELQKIKYGFPVETAEQAQKREKATAEFKRRTSEERSKSLRDLMQSYKESQTGGPAREMQNKRMLDKSGRLEAVKEAVDARLQSLKTQISVLEKMQEIIDNKPINEPEIPQFLQENSLSELKHEYLLHLNISNILSSVSFPLRAESTLTDSTGNPVLSAKEALDKAQNLELKDSLEKEKTPNEAQDFQIAKDRLVKVLRDEAQKPWSKAGTMDKVIENIINGLGQATEGNRSLVETQRTLFNEICMKTLNISDEKERLQQALELANEEVANAERRSNSMHADDNPEYKQESLNELDAALKLVDRIQLQLDNALRSSS